MSLMLSGNRVFNQDISSWDVSKVTDMSYLLSSAYTFNHDVTGWTMKDASVNVLGMFGGATAFLAAFTNCGHTASVDISICTSPSYTTSTATTNGPPTAWQINVPVVIIPPPVVVASPIVAAASPASTGTATAKASPASGGWKYSSALAAGDRIIFSPSYPSGLQNHVGVLETKTGDFITIATSGVSSSTVWKFCGVVPEGEKVFFAPYKRDNVGVFDTVTNVITNFATETNAASSMSKHCAAVRVGTKIFGYACSSLYQCSHKSNNQNA